MCKIRSKMSKFTTMSVVLTIVAFASLMVLTACSQPEKKARDAAATLNGLLTQAKDQNRASCQANPSQSVCQTINRGVDGQNALITAIQTYCGWSASTPPNDPNAKCVPVKGVEPILVSATNNVTQIISELRGVVK